MEVIKSISVLMMPAVILIIVVYGLIKKVSVFEVFLEGAEDGFRIVFKIMPTLIGLMIAVGIFRASGALDFITNLLKPLSDLVHFPSEIIPIALMRMVSSSAATGLVLDLFKQYGPDSLIGNMTSIMMGCTETILYTMSIYYMTVEIKKTRYTLTGALLANLAGILTSTFLAYKLF